MVENTRGIPVLNIENLMVRYRSSQEHIAVKDVSLTIHKGSIVGLVGESGCGKSTVARTVIWLDKETQVSPDSLIEFGGVNLLELQQKEFRKIRGRDIGMIFQDPMNSLNPSMTVGEQIEEPLKYHFRYSKKIREQMVLQSLSDVGIENVVDFAKKYPHELSGGLRQRVVIAQAMICDPQLVIADEPTTALDVLTQDEIIDLLVSLCEKKNSAVLFISHDLALVHKICESIYVMHRGAVVEHITDPKRILSSAKHPYTTGLLSCLPELNLDAEYLPTIDKAVTNYETK